MDLWGIVLQGLVVAVLCIGFAFTFTTERFPNFAHVSIANMGAFFAFAVVYFLGVNPYVSLPVTMLACGLLGAGVYLLLAHPLTRRGRSLIYLTLAMLAASWLLNSVFYVIRYWALLIEGIRNISFSLRGYDIRLFGLPASWVFIPISSLVVVACLYVFLSRSRLGLSLRAVSENEELSMVLGVDTFRAHLASWVLVGALAGYAGFVTTLLQGVNPLNADAILITVMAGSFLGGIWSVPGAAVGGFTLYVVQSYIVESMKIWLGNRQIPGFLNNSNLISLVALLPYVVIWGVLLFEPDGFYGIAERVRAHLRKPRDSV